VDTFDVDIERLRPSSGPTAYRDPGCPEPLLGSLREHGQTLSLLVAERPSELVLVSGHRRCHGLLRLRQAHASVSVTTAPSDLDLLRISILENSTSSGFNDVERARILQNLLDVYSLDANVVVTEWMPWLGLEPSIRLLKTYAFFGRESILHDGLRSGSITIGLGKGLIRFDRSELSSLADLLNSSGLSISQKKELLYILDELKRRDGASISKLVGTQESEQLLEELRGKRYPQIGVRKEQLNRLARKQPGWLTIREARNEGLEARVAFRGIEELRTRVRELLRISEDPEAVDILEKF
jgi:hypothetical protein